ncbi:MAG: MetQ/NlpA family ABC transporter substrate-binding protein [Solobacterium sp.]|nr:MetQ/NlpA family ABC transporter substrate-binding protein [Solobacterium sp.]
MKKNNVFKAFAASLLALTLAACGTATSEGTPASSGSSEPEKLTVIATANPHEIILNEVKPILLEKYNIDLEIIPTEDYYTPNRAVSDGDADANYFQHVPFFDNEKAENGYKISNVGGIHIEPFGFYSKKYSSIDELPDGAQIIISNSVADHGRILTILAKAGLLTLKDDVDSLSATIEDITDNPHGFTFFEVKPELLTNSLDDAAADLVAINGNYAIAAGLKPSQDALLLEQADQDNPYVNIVACQEGHESDAKIKALVEVLQSDDIRKFIETNWSDGSVIPATK